MQKLISIPKNGNGLTADRTLVRANKLKVLILPNKGWDRRLVPPDGQKPEKAGEKWSGTFVIYSKGKLGDTVNYYDSVAKQKYSFKVPEILVEEIPSKDEKGAVVAVAKKEVHVREEPGICLAVNQGFARGRRLISLGSDGKKLTYEITDPSQIQIIRDFPPSAHGWHLTETQFGIPVGGRVDPATPGARYLIRGSTYIGFIVRHGSEPKDVNMQVPPGFECGSLGVQLTLAQKIQGKIAHGAHIAARNTYLSPAVKEGVSFVKGCIKAINRFFQNPLHHL